MDEINFKGRAIYTTKGAAREYGRIGCNFYKGCPNECEYCYLKRGAPSKNLGGNTVQLKKCFRDEDDALRVFRKDVHTHLDECRKYGVFFSFTTDPMIEQTRELTFRAIGELLSLDVPAKVLTKDAWVNADVAIRRKSDFRSGLAKTGKRELLQLGFTLTGRDDMEPNASSNLERIQSMRLLHGIGFRTWASIEPVIDWQHANMAVEMSLDCCDHYKIGLRSGVRKDYYDLVQSAQWLDVLTGKITDAGRTVYLKESARTLLRRCYEEEYYNRILSRTVDMDGNQWQPVKESDDHEKTTTTDSRTD